MMSLICSKPFKVPHFLLGKSQSFYNDLASLLLLQSPITLLFPESMPLQPHWPLTVFQTTQGCLQLLFPLPGMLFPQISVWSIPSPHSSLCSNVPSLISPNLRILFKSAAPFPLTISLACLVPLTLLPLYYPLIYTNIFYNLSLYCVFSPVYLLYWNISSTRTSLFFCFWGFFCFFVFFLNISSF